MYKLNLDSKQGFYIDKLIFELSIQRALESSETKTITKVTAQNQPIFLETLDGFVVMIIVDIDTIHVLVLLELKDIANNTFTVDCVAIDPYNSANFSMA